MILRTLANTAILRPAMIYYSKLSAASKYQSILRYNSSSAPNSDSPNFHGASTSDAMPSKAYENIYDHELDHYTLHISATKNNTRLTLSNSIRETIFDITAGAVGYKNSSSSSPEAAYALFTHLVDRMRARNIKPRELEIVFSGFGKGRDPITQCLLGIEGAYLRDSISMVRDVTPIKRGGNRGKNVRRV